MKKRYTVAELFCGCGGFSRGFTRTGRFDVVLGNDIKKEALTTFGANHFGSRGRPVLLEGDIRSININDIKRALYDKGVERGGLDCLIGGPPCQGFSQMRRSEEREGSELVKFRGYDKLSHDPRNDLVLRLLEVAHELKPKVIVIENVPQILRHGYNGSLGGLADAVVEILHENMGYSVAVETLNAADYGVPQLRQRVFFIASRVGDIRFPSPTHSDPDGNGVLSPWVTVEAAIGDLPRPGFKNDELGGGPLETYLPRASEYAISLQSKKGFPHNHVMRTYSQRILDIISNMQPGETWDRASERMREKYELMLNRARRAGESRERTLERLVGAGCVNPVFFRKYYWSAYTRLAWDKPALTITANANFLGSGRYTHPVEDRGITVREAARLQSFDDDFRFITSVDRIFGEERIGVGMDMVGEAVPPVLGQAIAEQVLGTLTLDKERALGLKTRAEGQDDAYIGGVG